MPNTGEALGFPPAPAHSEDELVEVALQVARAPELGGAVEGGRDAGLPLAVSSRPDRLGVSEKANE